MKPIRASAVPYSPKRDAGYKSANDEDDPYNTRAKPPEPTSCPKCHATFMNGRWTWEAAPKDAYSQMCPACQRINDRFPAGYVTIKGEFFAKHRDEIVALISKHGEREKAQRPMLRRSLNGGSAPANCARKIPGPLIMAMSRPRISRACSDSRS